MPASLGQYVGRIARDDALMLINDRVADREEVASWAELEDGAPVLSGHGPVKHRQPLAVGSLLVDAQPGEYVIGTTSFVPPEAATVERWTHGLRFVSAGMALVICWPWATVEGTADVATGPVD